jgi:hypothetical protein
LKLKVADPELAALPWENLLKPLAPYEAVVRDSSVLPRAEGLPFTLPFRILQSDPLPGLDIGTIVSGVFGGHPREAVDQAIVTAQAVIIGGNLSPDPGWPTVDVLHIGSYRELVPQNAVSTARPEEPYTLGWLARFVHRYQTRLVMIDCNDEAAATSARRLGAAMIARGGPAVLVTKLAATEATNFYERFYAQLIHDFPLDSILVSSAYDLSTLPVLFVGAGREESLRASSVALRLFELGQDLVPGGPIPPIYLQTSNEARGPILEEIEKLEEAWPSTAFEFHESDGLIPLAGTLSRIRSTWQRSPQSPAPQSPPESRYVNSSLWQEAASSGKLEKLDPWKPVFHHQLYQLGIQVGPFDEVVPTARAQALIEEVFNWTPAMKGVWVEVGVSGLDFEVIGDPVQVLWLPREGPSEMIYFGVIPRSGTTPVLRFCLYYHNNVIQSFRLAAKTVDSNSRNLAKALDISIDEVGYAGYKARLEYSLLDDLAAVAGKPDRTVSIVANDIDGRPAITVKGADLFAVRIDNNLPKYVANVRKALVDISRQPVDGADEVDWPYRFQGASDIMRNKSTPKILEEALPVLAEPGWELYLQVIGAEQRSALDSALEPDRRTIHVAHVLRESVIPWGAVYGRKYDGRKQYDDNGKPVARGVCLAALPQEDGSLPANKCGALPNCLLHPDQVQKRQGAGERALLAETVVCPLHFWGFKHIIEIPPQQVEGSRRSGQSQRDRIRSGATTQMAAGINAKLPLAKDHQEELDAITAKPELAAAWTARESQRDRVLTKLKDTCLDIIYLYCHARGGQSDPGIDPPCLEFQEATETEPGKITSGDLEYDQLWTHGPLVFLNGCGTVGCSPDALSPFIKALVDDRGASGIIGTEIPVWEQLASEFARRFLEGFLKGLPAGDILLDVRRALLAQCNPLGLVYTLYAAAQLQLERNLSVPAQQIPGENAPPPGPSGVQTIEGKVYIGGLFIADVHRAKPPK